MKLDRPNNIGKRRRIRSISDKIRYFIIVDEVVHEQFLVEKGTRKLIYLQKIKI